MLGLAELGQSLSQEFDERENSLQTLRVQLVLELKQHQEELVQQSEAYQAEMRMERDQVKSDAYQLLKKSGEHLKVLILALKEDRATQRHEFREWSKVRVEEQKIWDQAVQYTHRKRSRG